MWEDRKGRKTLKMVWLLELPHGFDPSWPSLQAHPKQKGQIARDIWGSDSQRPSLKTELLSILPTSLGTELSPLYRSSELSLQLGEGLSSTQSRRVRSYLQRVVLSRAQTARNGPFYFRLAENKDVAGRSHLAVTLPDSLCGNQHATCIPLLGCGHAESCPLTGYNSFFQRVSKQNSQASHPRDSD